MTLPETLSASLAPRLPAGACDCHTHVFLDDRQYPFAAGRRYTPPPASIEQLVALHDALGIQRVVIVQASVYGSDNSTTLKAMQALGPSRARGVAVIDDSMSDTQLRQMDAAGIRGVRVNLEIDGERDSSKASDWLRSVAARVAPLGWHVQVFASLPLLAACSQLLGSLPVPLVFDHYAGAHAARGTDQQGLAEVLALVEAGKAYVKLSAPYRCSEPGQEARLDALTRLFIGCNAERMLWGSDWPHPQPTATVAPTDTAPPFVVNLPAVLGSVRRAAGNDTTLQRILVDNPQHLYGF